MTHGNPALLTLAIAMRQQGDEWDDLLYDLSRAPGLAALLPASGVTFRKRSADLLWHLAVFREPAPQDAWQAEQTRLAQLQQRELLLLDDQGGVRLPPHIHHLVYERIPAERRPRLHLQAAQIREARGGVCRRHAPLLPNRATSASRLALVQPAHSGNRPWSGRQGIGSAGSDCRRRSVRWSRPGRDARRLWVGAHPL
ncbi:MAG: hypothetical protein R3E79_40215 [Caldilineaceae bacterium]